MGAVICYIIVWVWWQLLAAPVAFARLVALLIWKANRYGARILCHVSYPLKPWHYLTIGAALYPWSCGTRGWLVRLSFFWGGEVNLFALPVIFKQLSFQTPYCPQIQFCYVVSLFSASAFFAFTVPEILLGSIWWNLYFPEYLLLILFVLARK
jgi:hypothetical protein